MKSRHHRFSLQDLRYAGSVPCRGLRFPPSPSSSKMNATKPNHRHKHTFLSLWREDRINIDIKKEGAKTDFWGKSFLRGRRSLCLLSPVVRVKLLFRISSKMIRTMCLSGRILAACRYGRGDRQCHKPLLGRQTPHRPF